MSTPTSGSPIHHFSDTLAKRGLIADPKARRNVALIVETSNDYARGILRGTHEFTRTHRDWSVYLTEHGRHELDESFIDNWEGDGVIARIETARTAEATRKLGVPAVDVSAARAQSRSSAPTRPESASDDPPTADEPRSWIAHSD